MNCIYQNCGRESGLLFVCDEHRKRGTKNALEKVWDAVREMIIGCAATGDDTYTCYHCGRDFTRDRICVDHCPRHRRGIRCAEMWDARNHKPSCMKCNAPGSKERAETIAGGAEKPWQERFTENLISIIYPSNP